ncbi:DUF4276 family protein [Tissierella pigra]|uniref:DUF4276 family protein n=1 Tax=Tissierella pigra TaxID=2607614 RepID=A0A6N7XIW6_9FIRM|nr:DUF4276 family protein [Tissierella pigra]MBU5425934.1 DUF4276 family protein [Tissierella pigra]MSU00702.1 DUF4276 family protein [Tissierella pigra]
MIRLFILCEGQTEERFVNELLSGYLSSKGIIVIPIILATKRTPTKKYKGGISSYNKIKSEVEILCKSDKAAFVTTMLDYYALPLDVPGRKEPIGKDIYEKVCYVEGQMYEDIALENFMPNIILHEFEGLLFSNPECFSYCDSDTRRIEEIVKIREENETPEHINDGVSTAPSKRVVKIFDNYDKIIDGINIAINIGIDCILKECHHFGKWIDKLCKLVNED